MTLKGGTGRAKRKPVATNSGERRRRHADPAQSQTSAGAESPAKDARSEIYSLVTTTDLALLATLVHDAIGHLMNAIDKAAKVQEPIERIADAMEATAAVIKSASHCQGSPMVSSSRKSARPAMADGDSGKSRGHRLEHHHRIGAEKAWE